MYNWHFTLAGDRDSPPLLLLHGWMGNCEDYRQVIELLKSHFYCIAIDLPGHGKTQTQSETGYNFIDTTRGIIQLLDDLNIEHCAIAGYSFGGRLALYLALEFPDRFDRVILESTSPGLATASERRLRITHDLQIIDRLMTEDLGEFVNNWYRQPLFIGIEKHPNFLDLIHRRIATNKPNYLAKSLQYAGLGMQPYLGKQLQNSTKPILLIAGELDLKFVALNRILERECQIVTLKIVPNCSHNIHFQQPQTWIDLCFKSEPQSF
jgi:2-succinyl-6-hydroxy-2,4-cyclohexadiene-1-carboxylate synthase